MSKQERQAWFIVATLFAALFLVFAGSYATSGVFFGPLLKQFHVSRARLSMLASLVTLSLGLSAPIIGWILDRVDARPVMVAGALISALSFIGASRVHSFPPLMMAYFMAGVGLGAATIVPTTLVISNWFGKRRGFAMGLAMAGTSVGAMSMTLVAQTAVDWGGWRFGYLVLAAPMLVVVIPMVLLFVRSKPTERVFGEAHDASGAVPGFEVAEALTTRSFWMIQVTQVCFAFVVTASIVHLIPYFRTLAFRPQSAAAVLSLSFGVATLGKLLMGWVADRMGARFAIAVNFAVEALAIVLLFAALAPWAVVTFIVLFGLTFESPLVLVPLLVAESLGLKRYGSLAGVTWLFNTVGAVLGPIVTGRIFDLTGRYTMAFELFVILLLVGIAACLACRPLAAAEVRIEQRAFSA